MKLKLFSIIFFLILFFIIAGCEDSVVGDKISSFKDKTISKQKIECECTKNVVFKNIKNPDNTFLTQTSTVKVPYNGHCSGLNGYFISNDKNAAQWYNNCVTESYRPTTTTLLPKIQTTTTTIPNSDLCKPFMFSGSPNTKFNFLFVSDRFTNEADFKSALDKLFDINKASSFFRIEPYKSQKNNMNIYYVHRDNQQYMELFDPNNYQGDRRVVTDYANRIKADCPYLFNNINSMVVVSSARFRAHSDTASPNTIYFMGPPVSLSVPNLDELNLEDNYPSNTLVHELGHSIAGFGENYYEEANFHYRPPLINFSSDTLPPDVDVEGCPKWCSGQINTESLCYNIYIDYKSCMSSAGNDESYKSCLSNADRALTLKLNDRSKYGIHMVNDCNMGKSCIEGTDCYFNAGGVFRFRSAKNSIMNEGPASLGYGSYSTTYLNNIFNNYISYFNIKQDIREVNLRITDYSFVRNDQALINGLIKFRLYNRNQSINLFSDVLKIEKIGADGRSSNEIIYRKNFNGEYYINPILYSRTGSEIFVFRIKINLPNFNKEWIYEYNSQTNIFRDISIQQNVYKEQNKNNPLPIVISNLSYNIGVGNK